MAAVGPGCKTSYLITTQDEINDSPYGTSDYGVNLRVKNAGKIAFSKIVVKYKDKDILFAGLKPGEVTCYKNLPSIWTNMSVEVFFSKQPEYYMKLTGVAIDHQSEKLITHGYATINIAVKNIKGSLGYDENIILDEK